ncbi:MAG: WYL domain-containing protein [Mucilaginibacter polytrichastri]|nr:WYL domain-containing protein [Mucilaginibacter polytrichastri]
MNRIDRLLGLLTLLQSRRFTPAEHIAKTYSTSLRTVYRDLKALNELGIPLGLEPAKGYFVAEGYFLPPVSFSTEEANALLIIEAIVDGFADETTRTRYARILEKVKSVMPEHQKQAVNNLAGRIGMQLPSRFGADTGSLYLIQQAIAAKHIIRLAYTNAKNENTTRDIEPIGIVFYALSWHVIGWCHKRMDYRDFKLLRIVSASDTKIPFTRTDHIRLEAYMQQLPVNF